MKVSFVVPTLNEEKNITKILDDLIEESKKKKLDCEIIVVDGHSIDRTVDLAKKYNVKIIYDDFGKGSALRKGMKSAKGNIIITIDADCSHRTSEIGLLIEGIESGYDICAGSRFIQGGGTEDMQFYRRFGNKFFVFLVNLFFKTNYSDLCYGYRSFRKDCIKKLGLHSNGFGIETEIAIKAAKKKLKVLEIPSFEKIRRDGEGKLRTFKDGFDILSIILREIS